MQTSAIRTLTVRGQSQGLDKVTADLNGVSAAQEKVSRTGEGLARTTDTVSKRQLSAANSFERLMERNDRMIYLQRQLDREMLTVNRAYETGHATMERHGQAVALVQAKYDRLIAAEAAARQQVTSTTGAFELQTTAVHRLAVANDNLAASSESARGNTANIAAQFQDIGVTAAMGMNPVMIALQQGTQLSAVLNTMQNPIRGLATAFLSIINPVSLLTIGFVALGAVAIQWFMGAKSEAEEAGDALQAHNEWLTTILKGYDSAQEASKRYREEAEKLPEASVASDLAADRVRALDAYADRLTALQSQQADFQRYIDERARGAALFGNVDGAGDAVAKLQAVMDVVQKAGVSAASTADDFNGLHVILTDLKNNGVDQQIVHIAETLLTLLRDANAARVEVDGLGVSLDSLPSNILTTISVRMEGYNDAREQLDGLMPDFRDRYTKMRDEANEAHARMRTEATDGILRLQADKDLERVLDGINRLQSEDNARQAARAGSTITEVDKAARSYDDLTNSARGFVAEQQLNITTLGMSAEAASRLRHEQDMLNQAANDNIKLSPLQRAEISALAEGMAAAEERSRSLTEMYNFGQQTLSSFLGNFRRELMAGTSLWDSFASAAAKALDSIADRAMSMAANGIFDMIFNAVMGGMGGGFGTIGMGGVGMPTGGFTPGLSGPRLFDTGGWTGYGDPSRIAGYVHEEEFVVKAGPAAANRAVLEQMNRGAVTANSNMPAAANVNVQIIDQRQSGTIQRQETKGANGETELRLIIRDEVQQATRRGAMGF